MWANFISESSGCHTWVDGVRPDIAMLSPHFGVNWAWHARFSKRILHHHATFLGESMVHGLAEAGVDHGNERIADAWCKLQLLTKWEYLTHEAFPLSMPFTEIFAAHQQAYDNYVKSQFAKTAPQPKCLVLDGNQKLTRRTCAEQLVDMESIPGTPAFFLQDCNRTPKRKSKFCSAHSGPSKGNCRVRVCKKDCVGDGPASLLRTAPATGVVDWPLPDWLRKQVHHQSLQKQTSTNDADIAMASSFVSCRTIKMRKRVNRRSGGWLVACDERGFVIGASEFLGGESLTQRAAFLARMVHEYPSVSTVVHDDACHLRLFVDRWFRNTLICVTQPLALLSINFTAPRAPTNFAERIAAQQQKRTQNE